MAKRFLILTDTIGRDDAGLGRVLIRSFFYSLARNEEVPTAVMMMNEGVRLVCEGSEVIDDLRILEEKGVVLRACGTCLDYLELSDQLQVGQVGNMNDSVAVLAGSDAVVTIA